MIERRWSQELRRYADIAIVLSRFTKARAVCADVGPRRFLHAGPPIDPREVTGPSRGAIIAGLLLEGEAADPRGAARIVDEGGVELVSCHEVGGVGPLAGVVTPEMPVVVVESDDGDRAFAPLNEGLGSAVRFGNFDDATIERLRWLGQEVGPALDRALNGMDLIDVTKVQAAGLRRGDECHNRNVASMAQLVTRLAPAIVETSSRAVAVRVLKELANNVQFFLPISMAAAKVMADRVHRGSVPGVLTAIASNGREIGIRVSGSASTWYTCPSVLPDRLKLREGFVRDDANPFLGDSAVAEAVGLGASSLTCSPVLAERLGIPFYEAQRIVADLRTVCLTESPRYMLPADGFRGAPFAMYLPRIIERRVAPVFSAGFAHREAGRGPVAAGLMSVPMDLLDSAFTAMSKTDVFADTIT